MVITENKTTISTSPGQRFRRVQRIADQHSYSRVFKQSQRSRDKMFTVLYRPNGTRTARLGLAIGKKNCRTSTGRNRLKRVIRESFRRHQEALSGIDIVVMNQAAAANACNKLLFESLERHWSRCRPRQAGNLG